MDLMELLEKGDVETFNATRPESGKLDLFAADLAEVSLVGVDLSRANVDKSDFTGADLSDSTLLGASLSGIDGTGMKLCNALAIKARAKEAWMDECDLSEADFTRGNFTEAVLERSIGTGVVFAGARLVEVNAKGASWTDADLVEASMHKIDLTGADLRRADLSEAKATEANLTEAKLDQAVGPHARLSGAILVGASLVGARFPGANLQGADLTNADLSMSDLTGANLTDAKLEGAKLQGAVLADAVLDGVALTGIDLTGVDLSGVDPTPLGLSQEQLDQVAAIGVEVPKDAPIQVSGALGARSGSNHLVLWDNVDGKTEEDEPITSLRYAVFGKKPSGPRVLPVPADKVLARSIGTDGDGFRVAVLRDRPGGVALVVYRIEGDGTIADASSGALGYDPMVRPVMGEDGKPVLWGMARRGPTLVVHRPGDDGFVPVHSQRIATARGFLGKHHPVIASKGGTVQVATARGGGSPRRTPDGFPGRLGSAAPVDDRILCVWIVERVGDTPGGLRFAWLERRGNPETEVLTTNDMVTSLDVLGQGERAHLCWVEISLGGGQLWTCSFPDPAPKKIAEDIDASRVSFTSTASGEPALLVTTTDGLPVVIEPGGKRHVLEVIP